MNEKSSGRASIPLRDIWFVLWNRKNRIALIVLFFVVLGVTVAGISNVRKSMHPRYITTAAFTVISEDYNGNFAYDSQTPTHDEVYMAQKMADSVIYIAKSDKVLDEVIEALDLKQTQLEELKEALLLEQYEDSQVIIITLNWYDDEEGVRILGVLADVLPGALIESLKIGGVEIVDFPRAAVQEEGYNLLLVMLIMLLAGLVVGILLYILLLIFRPTFLSGTDVEDVLEVPLLGEITADKNWRTLNPHEMTEKGEQILSGLFIEQSSFCAHILRNILDEKKQKSVFITSTLASEGKTSFTAVIAWQLALQEKRVLLVDLDIRKPSLGRYFFQKLDRNKTVNAVAKGITTAEEACIDINEYLTVLPGYLEKSRISIDNDLVEKLLFLSEKYDYVLIDSSPVGLVSDVMRLKKLSDCAVLVVEQGKAWQGLVAECVTRLEKGGISIAGAALNKVNISTPANRYYYRNYGNDLYYYSGESKKKVRKKADTSHEGKTGDK